MQVKPASRTAAAAGAAAAPPRPAERQLPPVPRFDEQRPAAASRAAAAEVVTTAAPNRRPLAAVAGTHAATASRPPVPAAPPAARPQQVVLREGGAAGRSGRDEEEDGEEDETAPVVLSKLAQRVQRGRQSLAPSKASCAGRGAALCCLQECSHATVLPLLALPARLQPHPPLCPACCRLCWVGMAACCTAAVRASLGLTTAMMMSPRCQWATLPPRQQLQRRTTLMPRDLWHVRPAAGQRRRCRSALRGLACRSTAPETWLSRAQALPASERCLCHRRRLQRWLLRRLPLRHACPWVRRRPSRPAQPHQQRSTQRGQGGGWWRTKTR